MKRGEMKYYWKIAENDTSPRETMKSRFKTRALNLQTAIRAIHSYAKIYICHKGELPLPVQKMTIVQYRDFFTVDFGSKFFHGIIWNRHA